MINTLKRENQFLLKSFVSSGNIGAIQNMVKEQPQLIEINLGDYLGSNIILWSIHQKKDDLLKELLKITTSKGLEFVDNEGNNVLHYLAKSTYVSYKFIHDIIEKNKKIINVINKAGVTPLIICGENANTINLFEIFLKYDANVNLGSPTSGYYQFIAKNESILKLVLDRMTDYSKKDNEKEQTLLYYIIKSSFNCSRENYLSLMPYFKKFDFSVKDKNLMTPFMYAINDNWNDFLIDQLFNENYNVDDVNIKKETAIHLAIKGNISDKKIIEYLMKAKSLNAKDSSGDDYWTSALKGRRPDLANSIKIITEQRLIGNRVNPIVEFKEKEVIKRKVIKV